MAQTQGPTLEQIATQGLSGITGGFRDAIQRYFNNLTGLLEYQRTANVFNTATAAASGDNAIWAPSASTLKFRLMGGLITIPTNVNRSAGADTKMTFRDGTTDLKLAFYPFIPTTAVTTVAGAVILPFYLPGNGILSAAANNTLNLNLAAAISTGAIGVTVWGTEE